jgi:hypothetical protein
MARSRSCPRSPRPQTIGTILSLPDDAAVPENGNGAFSICGVPRRASACALRIVDIRAQPVPVAFPSLSSALICAQRPLLRIYNIQKKLR